MSGAPDPVPPAGALARRAPWLVPLAAAGVLAWSLARERPTSRLAPDVPLGAPLSAPALDGADPAPGPAPDEPSAPPEPPPPGAEVDFEWLAFPTYDPPALRGSTEALGLADFPPRARALHDREVALVGYPLVTGGDGREVRELLLTRYPPGCCFGTLPVLDEWVQVRLAEPLAAGDLPRRLYVRGRLDVGEELDELGTALRLYRLDAEAAAPR